MSTKFIALPLILTQLCILKISLGQEILSTTYNNTFSPVICGSSSDDWAKCNCNGGTWPTNTNAPFEWKRVGEGQSKSEHLNFDKIFGLSGTVMYQAPAGSDFPLSHVFGYNPNIPGTKLLTDWESYIVVDPPYANLLGKGNNPRDANGNRFDNEFTTAIKNALASNKNFPTIQSGVMGVEFESGLIPPNYQSLQGDRTAVFGDLIADCGHDEDGFHTEIHPPLMLVNARPFNGVNPLNSQQKIPDSATDVTFATVISRPYTLTQYYNGGNTFLNAAAEEIGKAVSAAELSQPFSLATAVYHLTMNADLADKPFHGLPLMIFDVFPQKPKTSPDEILWVQYHFTVRTGVAVQIGKSGDHITVLVGMNDLNYNSANNLLIKHNRNLNQNDFSGEYTNTFTGVFLTANVIPGLTPILAQGIQSTVYESPVPHSNFDLNISSSPTQAQPNNFDDKSDDQPFPIYGWITIGWLKPTRLIIKNACLLHPSPLTSNLNEVNFFPNNLDKTQLVTITNPTNMPLQLGKISLTGVNPDEFLLHNQRAILLPIINGHRIGSQPPEDCSNSILQPHGSCSFRVEMKPNNTGVNFKAIINVPSITQQIPCPLSITVQQLNGVN